MKPLIVGILLFLACVVLFGFNLGDLSMLKGDENYYFSGAKRMIADDDWVTPRYHHHIRFEKPPLFYWVIAISFNLLGVSWLAARAASAFLGCLTVFLTYLLSLRFFSRKVAVLSASMLATSFLFFSYARLAVIDMTFLFLITLSLFFFVKGKDDNKAFLLLAFIPMGLSVLAKGPLGLLVVGLVILAYIITTREFRLLKEMNLFLGIIILTLIILPWPMRMIAEHGDTFIKHIWEVEALDKTVGSFLKIGKITNIPRFALKYLGYYVPVVMFSFAPWGLFLPFGIFRKFKNAKNRGSAFVLSWFWVVFLLFTLASFKHTHYMLLLSPPLAIIVANLFSRKGAKAAIVISIITAILYISVVGFILPALNDNALKNFSLTLVSEVKLDEKIGLASREFNLKKLGVNLNNLVSGPYEASADDLARYKQVSKDGRLIPFLESDERVYCLITKDDYLKKVPEGLRNKLHILDTNPVWKKFDIDEVTRAIIDKDLNQLRQDSYLISNSRG